MSTTTKTSREVILPLAEELLERLEPYCDRIALAGSIRRETPLVGDIEIVAIPRRLTNLFGEVIPDAPTELDRYLDATGVEFNKRGTRYQQFLHDGRKVDLFLPTPDTWGVIFTIRTGSWEFSRWLVTPQAYGGAAPPGTVCKEGRIWHNGRLLETTEERHVFNSLGLNWIDPRDRKGPISNPVRYELPIRIYEDV